MHTEYHRVDDLPNPWSRPGRSPESHAIETYISSLPPSLFTNSDFYVSADFTISPSTPIHWRQQRFPLKRGSDACKTCCTHAVVNEPSFWGSGSVPRQAAATMVILNGISLIVLVAVLYLCERIVSLPTQKCGGRQSAARSLHSANRCHFCSQLTDESSAPSHPLYPSTYSRA